MSCTISTKYIHEQMMRELQVVLLDPVQYPGAMKAFAREVCRNDLLNFGRLHFFFPDSRMSLDLNTDKTLKVSCRGSFGWLANEAFSA